MTDYSQLYLIWPPIAILLIGLLSGWFLQRHVLLKQMEELETQHLDLLRAAEDEMHAARDEARLQGQKLDEAQMAITLGYERLTLLDRRLNQAQDLVTASQQKTVTDPATATESEEVERLRRQLAEQEVFAHRLNELERELTIAKAAALAEPAPVAAPQPVVLHQTDDQTAEIRARVLREREITIESLRHEVAGVENLRLRLSELVSELGSAHAQVGQLTKERNALASLTRTVAVPTETSNELVRKLADAIARRQEAELALADANRHIQAVEAERDRLIANGQPKTVAIPRAMSAAAGSGLGFSVTSWQAEYEPAQPLDEPLEPLPRQAFEPPAPPAPVRLEIPVEERPELAIPLLSPAQLAGGLSQLLFENRIQFNPDRADILPDSKLLLEDISDLILSSEPVRLIIEGHTERGDARTSFYLSEHRAVAVMDRLVKLGVPESRMMTVGYGDTRPIDENSSYEGRLRNRRIEIRVLGRL